MTELATLGLSIRSDGVVVATDRLKDFAGAGKHAEDVSGSLVRMATRAGAALGAAFSIRVLQNYADGWSDMQSRIGASIKSMEAAPAFMQRITDIANASYSPLQQTTEIFGRNVTVLNAMGRSAVEAADFTEALNHALVTTATKGQDADVVLNALSRSIAIGGMRAMEFETIMSRSPRVLEAIAQELDTNVTGLRALAQEGKVTGTVIVDALINSLEQLRDEAGAMPATLRDAGMIWTNVFTEVVGRVDQAWQATGRLAASSIELAIAFRGTADNLIRIGNIVGTVVGPAFDMLGANMGTIASVAGIAVAALAGFYAPAMIGGLWSLSAALVTGVAGGIKAITLAMMANPIGVLIGGLALGVTAAFLFRDKIKDAIGVDVVEVFRDGANTIIGAMVGAVDASKAAFEVFPDFMAGLGARAWNSFLEGFEGSAVSWTNPFTGETFDLLNINLSTFKKDVGGAGGAAVDAVSQAFQKAQGVDYVGAIASSLGKVWESAAGAGDAIAGLAGQLGEGGAAGGQGLAGAASAANDNIKTLGDTTQSVLSDMYNTGKSVFSGFFSDLKSGLKDGQTFWEALGNAGANALDKIADRALSMAANGIFDMIFGSIMGGITGGFGGNSLGGGWGVAGGFGRPGIFGIPGMADGGTVGRAGLSWVGERGPELLRLPQGAQVIPNGPSMAMAANSNGGGDIVINNVINVPAGTSPETAPAIAREVAKELRKQLPDAMDRRDRNPLRRAS